MNQAAAIKKGPKAMDYYNIKEKARKAAIQYLLDQAKKRKER